MKTLIINNHTKYLKKLVSIFQNVTIVEKEDIQKINLNLYSLLVLSGGSQIPSVLRHVDEYSSEIRLIKEAQIPIIGICLGAEIITKAFEGELQELPIEYRGKVQLELLNESLIEIFGSNSIEVVEGHHIGIKTVPKNFIVYAQSEHGPEIIKYKDKPIIAIQFHPEISNNKKITNWLLSEVNQ